MRQKPFLTPVPWAGGCPKAARERSVRGATSPTGTARGMISVPERQADGSGHSPVSGSGILPVVCGTEIPVKRTITAGTSGYGVQLFRAPPVTVTGLGMMNPACKRLPVVFAATALRSAAYGSNGDTEGGAMPRRMLLRGLRSLRSSVANKTANGSAATGGPEPPKNTSKRPIHHSQVRKIAIFAFRRISVKSPRQQAAFAAAGHAARSHPRRRAATSRCSLCPRWLRTEKRSYILSSRP